MRGGGCDRFFWHAFLGRHPDRSGGVSPWSFSLSHGEISPLARLGGEADGAAFGGLGRNDKLGVVPRECSCQKKQSHPRRPFLAAARGAEKEAATQWIAAIFFGEGGGSGDPPPFSY
jgi:hypothetical protein